MWLSYKDGEIAAFHPAFAEIGERVLKRLRLDGSHHWEHHPSTAGVGVVPDFVLVDSSTGRWVLIVEIKRTPDAVGSERAQIQAKGYAEANKLNFVPGRPLYFAVSNLELTQLYAVRGDLPPRDCLIEGMAFDSGRFRSTPEGLHQATLEGDLITVVQFCLSPAVPTFATVWPTVVRTVYQHASTIPFDPKMDTSAGQLPDAVRDYFAVDHQFIARSEMLVRCLFAEYLRGLLRRHDHAQKNSLRAVGGTLASAANAMAALRRIDFRGVIEGAAGPLYLSFEGRTEIQNPIQAYLATLQAERVDSHAASRNDVSQLADLLIRESRPAATRDMRGKAATDPELASLLAAFAITDPEQTVLDPGCGEGNLLSAAYDRLKTLGLDHAAALGRILGMEADSLAARVAALRLSIKEPKVVSETDPCFIRVADMFSNPEDIRRADVVLMNPPFKRYEAQDAGAIPPALREHVVNSVLRLDGKAEVVEGQWNLLAAYAEFVVKAAKEGATLAFVLDNKWLHNEASTPLRNLFLRRCRILAVVTYPHGRFFEGVMIATSMVVMVKGAPTGGDVAFARVDDPAVADATAAAYAIRGGPVPTGWAVRQVAQADLTSGSWKRHLATHLLNEFRAAPLVRLPSLFSRARRGSLAKEGGGIAVFEFPVNRTNYGPTRRFKPGGSPFQTISGPPLTRVQNDAIRAIASRIPDNCLGYALNRADAVSGYVLTERDVSVDRTIEVPDQRQPTFSSLYFQGRRVRWSPQMDALVAAIRGIPELADYVSAIETQVGLDRTVLPDEQRWNVLREPYAGELVIPRKLRNRHHVHINRFAFESGRQLRLSSNFLSYGGCVATDIPAGLDAELATTIIAAWLVSSFGHVQFELESNNREGLRTIEQADAERIWVPDPRLISLDGRRKIVDAFNALPFSVRTDLHPALQPELVALDEAFAEELASVFPGFNQRDGLTEVHELLHDLHEARNP